MHRSSAHTLTGLYLAALMAILIPRAANAGNGTFESGKFNFCLSVRYNASASELTTIRSRFQAGSDILLDATDNQHRFGTIRIVNDSGAPNSAEYWVIDGGGRSLATYGKYGTRGEHVNLYLDEGATGDAYTVAHEHAHHVYSLGDEYAGSGGVLAECAATNSTSLNYSLMDNYFTLGGNTGTGSTYTLNEFCVSSNHDPDMDTVQEIINGESSWETIAGQTRFPATAPSGLPVDAPPASQTVTFVDGFGGLRVMLLLDRSGSMEFNQRLEFAQLGAKRFVDLVSADDEIGVASFASSGGVDFMLANAGTSASAAKDEIDLLSASGGTNVGGGLNAALGELTGQTDRSCNEIIVLLSDGDHNTGTAPVDVIPTLKSEGVTVLAIGVGSGLSTAGEMTLQDIATETGGRFFRIASSADLESIFIVIAAEATGSGLLTRQPLNLSSGEVVETGILIEPGVESAIFAFTKSAADDIVFSLRTPSGVTLTSANDGDPGIVVMADSTGTVFEIVAPEPGLWQMISSAATVVGGDVDLVATARHVGVQVNLSVDESAVTFPAPVMLTASVLFEGEPVIGAGVTGIVRAPDGSEIGIELFDDGFAPDEFPADGFYGGSFLQYSLDGTYTFEVTAVVEDGRTFAGEALFISTGAPSNERPVPDFVRSASTTAVVTGIPNIVVATLEIGPETINLKSKGKWVTAYLELPAGFDPAAIDVNSLAITSIDDLPISPIPAELKPTNVGDFDNDSIPDLMVKFSREALQSVLRRGLRDIEIQGMVAGELLVGRREVGVKAPGNPDPGRRFGACGFGFELILLVPALVWLRRRRRAV